MKFVEVLAFLERRGWRLHQICGTDRLFYHAAHPRIVVLVEVQDGLVDEDLFKKLEQFLEQLERGTAD